ncbi:MAG: bacillithiol biosynthesis deacetylase BshB1 [Candidatus Kapabacteria bacterium]|nr:bacillithiol biosynthesis deacetylase BshB1 [Candidatus Kapabacteria bacterium]
MSTVVMVLSAHPDDAELSCAGTVKNLTNEGHTVVFVECTRGELGSRGTPELREKEAIAAAKILGVENRICLNLPDGNIMHTNDNILAVVVALRTWRPKLLLIPPPIERHPDHEAVNRLARAAAFLSGLTKIETHHNGALQQPHRPERMLCFQQQYDFPREPDLYVDITNSFEAKMASVRAFSSQFHLPDEYVSDEPATFISRPEFLQEIEARALYQGSRIGVRYAEAFLAVEPLGVSSLSVLL